MKLTSGVKKRIRQQSALELRKSHVALYEASDCGFSPKEHKRKLNLAKREVAILEQKLGLI